MRCPKCKAINPPEAKECGDCAVVFADIRSGRSAPQVNLDCPWNDHGLICGKRGSISESTLGYGPWYCSEHYWRLKGWPIKPNDKLAISYRARRYAELGKDYEPPKLPDPIKLPARLRQREPGDDDDIPQESA
jgi:hypothetical protein